MSLLPRKEWRLVMVTWHDAYSHVEQPWYTLEEMEREADGHMVCLTAGWLIRDDSDYVTVCLSAGTLEDADKDIGPAVSIPRGMVIKMETLEPWVVPNT